MMTGGIYRIAPYSKTAGVMKTRRFIAKKQEVDNSYARV